MRIKTLASHFACTMNSPGFNEDIKVGNRNGCWQNGVSHSNLIQGSKALKLSGAKPGMTFEH